MALNISPPAVNGVDADLVSFNIVQPWSELLPFDKITRVAIDKANSFSWASLSLWLWFVQHYGYPAATLYVCHHTFMSPHSSHFKLNTETSQLFIGAPTKRLYVKEARTSYQFFPTRSRGYSCPNFISCDWKRQNNWPKPWATCSYVNYKQQAIQVAIRCYGCWNNSISVIVTEERLIQMDKA